MLFKLSNLNSTLALTLDYLNLALNNSALKYNLLRFLVGLPLSLLPCNSIQNSIWLTH